MADVYEQDAQPAEKAELGRKELEHLAGLLAQTLSTTRDAALITGGDDRPDPGEFYDLASLFSTEPPRVEKDRLYAQNNRETVTPNPGETSVPHHRSREQVSAAAAVAIEVHFLIERARSEYMLDSASVRGSAVDLIESIMGESMELLIQLGDVLRQPGDRLCVGQRELSKWDLEEIEKKRAKQNGNLALVT